MFPLLFSTVYIVIINRTSTVRVADDATLNDNNEMRVVVFFLCEVRRGKEGKESKVR